MCLSVGLVGWWEVHLPSEIAKWSLCRIFNTKSRSLETEIYGHILRLWLREICYNVWITKYEWPFGWLADWLSNINTYIGLSPLIFPNSFEKKYDAHTHRHTHRPRRKQLTPCKCISQPSDPTDLNRICWLQQSEIALCRRIAFPFASDRMVCSFFFWFTHFLIMLPSILTPYMCGSRARFFRRIENCIPIFIIGKKLSNLFNNNNNNKTWSQFNQKCEIFLKLEVPVVIKTWWNSWSVVTVMR